MSQARQPRPAPADARPRWRRGYDALESAVGPQLESFVRSDQFAQGVGVVSQLVRELEQRSARMTRQVLHRLNLPAGTDITRLLTEIGDLKRQVRKLSEQLEAREDVPAEQPARRPRKAASTTTTKRSRARARS